MKEQIRQFFRGDLDDSRETLEKYSRDASLFEIRPELVVYPKDSADIQELVKWVGKHKVQFPHLSLTVRAAGTDMSGGAVNDSIIIDVTRYMNHIISIDEKYAVAEPGVYYRDMEKETLARGVIMPSFTASKDLCAVGGMVGNNAGGEKSIKYGKTENYIASLNIILSDGYEYTIRPLSERELSAKMTEKSLIGELYRKLFSLISENKEIIALARPQVSKNSAGYYLWNIFDDKTKTFDVCRLIVGSQGTLGIVTEITFRLVPVQKHQNLIAIFLPHIQKLGEVVDQILPLEPESFESYDDYSMKLAVRFAPSLVRQMGFVQSLKLLWQFIPDLWLVLRGGMPKLVLLVEMAGDSEEEVARKLSLVAQTIEPYGYKYRIAKNTLEAEKYWRIRHESFNLLRSHVKGKQTAPFIDDIIVPPEHLPTFLPELQALLSEYKLVYTIAGHAGNGNFHIIPLMDMTEPLSEGVILNLSKRVYTLVIRYGGSITAEHNDGIIRTPYLVQMYGGDIIKLFQVVKDMFDPLNIFNPGKKVGGTIEDIRQHLSRRSKNHAHNS